MQNIHIYWKSEKTKLNYYFYKENIISLAVIQLVDKINYCVIYTYEKHGRFTANITNITENRRNLELVYQTVKTSVPDIPTDIRFLPQK